MPIDESYIPCVKFPPRDFDVFYNFNILKVISSLAFFGLSCFFNF